MSKPGPNDVSALVAIEPVGKQKWLVYLNGNLQSISVIRPDGRLVLQYKFSNSIIVRTNETTAVVEATIPQAIFAVDNNNVMYGSDSEGRVYKLHPNGTTIWAKQLDTAVTGISVDEGGVAYVSGLGSLYALAVANGSVLWVLRIPEQRTNVTMFFCVIG